MALADRVDEMLRGLPRGWERARIELSVEEEDEADRASLILAPATPGRSGSTFTVYVHNGTQRLAPTPELVRRVVARLDTEGIRGRVRLAGHEDTTETPVQPESPVERGPLAGSWDALVRRLPPDYRPEWPRTRSVEDVLEHHLEPLGVPVLYKLPLGHGKHLATIPLGVTATLDADARTLAIESPGLTTGGEGE
jgi:hypothetical protein